MGGHGTSKDQQIEFWLSWALFPEWYSMVRAELITGQTYCLAVTGLKERVPALRCL